MMKTLSRGLLLAVLACAPARAQVPSVSIANNIPTYMAADANIANTGAGDIFCLAGGAGKQLFVNTIHTNAVATAAIVVNVSVIKRSSAASGGTPVAETAVALNSDNAAAVGTATGYTVSPTPGTAIGTIVAHKVAAGVQGNTAAITDAEFFFGANSDQPVRLTSTQSLCINVSAAGAGASWAVTMRWTEQ